MGDITFEYESNEMPAVERMWGKIAIAKYF